MSPDTSQPQSERICVRCGDDHFTVDHDAIVARLAARAQARFHRQAREEADAQMIVADLLAARFDRRVTCSSAAQAERVTDRALRILSEIGPRSSAHES